MRIHQRGRRRGKTWTGALAALTLAAAVGGTAEAAQAATVSVQSGRLTYAPNAGTAEDRFWAVQQGSNYLIQDSSSASPALLRAGSGCTLVDARNVTCPVSSVTSADLDGGGGPDYIVNQLPLPTAIRGGAGNDLIMPFGSGQETVLGGDGTDWVPYWGGGATSAVLVTLDSVFDDGPVGQAKRDFIASDVENVIGSAFNDVIVGNAAANYLEGGGGRDILRGGAGDDTFTTRDAGEEDTIDCGPGNDTAYVGPEDRFTDRAACESVIVS